MDVDISNIFSHDALKEYLREGHSAYVTIDKNNGALSIVVHDKFDRNDIFKTIPIHELNEITDYTEHIYTDFRRSNLSSEIEAYNNVSITPDKLDKLYCASGLASEAGEVNKVLMRNFFFAKEINDVDLMSELGDHSWYSMTLLKLLKIKIIDIFKTNIIKLKVRYPSKDIKLESRNDNAENEAIKSYLNKKS